MPLDQMDTTASFAPVLRREQLRDGFRATVDALDRCHAGHVPDGFIADYVALNWLEWHGGVLRVTPRGQNMRSRQAERTGAAVA